MTTISSQAKPFIKLPESEEFYKTKKILEDVCTICIEGNCPNRNECFSKNTATFMILGDRCTRNCRYCSVIKSKPKPIDEHEPERIAIAAAKLSLKHVVITSVTRDDLPDLGSEQFIKTAKLLKDNGCTVELLVPDFPENSTAAENIFKTNIDIFAHNIELAKELFPLIRPKASYQQSLNLLKAAKKNMNNCFIKSGFMIGLGETLEMIERTLDDLEKAGVEIVTIGQYLKPSHNCIEVEKYYTDSEFKEIEKIAIRKGFKKVIVGKLVRSSYKSQETLNILKETQ